MSILVPPGTWQLQFQWTEGFWKTLPRLELIVGYKSEEASYCNLSFLDGKYAFAREYHYACFFFPSKESAEAAEGRVKKFLPEIGAQIVPPSPGIDLAYSNSDHLDVLKKVDGFGASFGTKTATVYLDPDKMHGAADGFGGSDYCDTRPPLTDEQFRALYADQAKPDLTDNQFAQQYADEPTRKPEPGLAVSGSMSWDEARAMGNGIAELAHKLHTPIVVAIQKPETEQAFKGAWVKRNRFGVSLEEARKFGWQWPDGWTRKDSEYLFPLPEGYRWLDTGEKAERGDLAFFLQAEGPRPIMIGFMVSEKGSLVARKNPDRIVFPEMDPGF